jgi:predicted NBD/HSP70 family sugar kinase
MGDLTGSTAALRRHNTSRILQEVRSSGGLVQAEIARRTGLSPATVTNLVRELTEAGMVVAEERVHQGRKAKWVSVNAGAGYVLGVDIDRTHMMVNVVDMGFNVIGTVARRFTLGMDSSAGFALLGELFREVLDSTGVDRGRIRSAGVGIPGPVDRVRGQIGAPSFLPEWAGIDLPGGFTDALGMPVVIDNDSNLGALGEYAWPPALDVGSLFYVWLSTGIGGGLIVDGQPWRGADGTAGEIGHHSIDEAGPICRCGNRGCVEAIVSVPECIRVLSVAVGHEVDTDDWVRLAQQGNTTARRLLEDLARHVGVAVANIVNLVNPSRVVVGGPISVVDDVLLDPLRAEVRQRAVPAATRSIQIDRARWGDFSRVYGAAILAMSNLD